jgi:tetratricopeptide (TPR) repeat protein
MLALNKTFSYPLTPLRFTPMPQYAMTDITMACAGVRRLGAGLAWVQLLQYYGDSDNGPSRYKDFLQYCWRIFYFDPFASYAYLTGSAGLAFNMGRPEEALQLLEYGIKVTDEYGANMTSDPRQSFWQYHLYISAIIYKQKGDFGNMITMLVKAAQQPNCPNMLKAVLANILESTNDYRGALRLWYEVYSTRDPMYLERSEQKIIELRKLLPGAP